MTDDFGQLIHNKALEYGYDNCGVVSIDALDGYEKHLTERLDKYPEANPILASCKGFLEIKKKYPWAKSIVICTEYYGRFKFPKSLRGRYATAFLLSSSYAEHPGRDGKAQFENWMNSANIHFVGGEIDLPSRALPLRWAAVKAGLGIFRKNNFFYGPKGSYYALEGYFIDKECEYIQKSDLKPCADGCHRCQDACKTKSLSAPYTMNPMKCISFLTSFGGGYVAEPLKKEQLDQWIFGCDSCQNACPYNMKHNWDEGEDFPGLGEAEKTLDPHNIIAASDEELLLEVFPRTDFHLSPDQINVLRINAQRALDNMMVK